MRIDEGDEIVGLEILSPTLANAQILTVTEKGYGKRTLIEEYRLQGRGGSGVMTIKVTDKNGPVVAVRQVVDSDQLIIASDHGKVIRTRISEISEVGRIAQGVRLINLEEGESVAAVAKVDDDEGPKTPDSPESSETPPPATPAGNA